MSRECAKTASIGSMIVESTPPQDGREREERTAFVISSPGKHGRTRTTTVDASAKKNAKDKALSSPERASFIWQGGFPSRYGWLIHENYEAIAPKIGDQRQAFARVEDRKGVRIWAEQCLCGHVPLVVDFLDGTLAKCQRCGTNYKIVAVEENGFTSLRWAYKDTSSSYFWLQRHRRTR